MRLLSASQWALAVQACTGNAPTDKTSAPSRHGDGAQHREARAPCWKTPHYAVGQLARNGAPQLPLTQMTLPDWALPFLGRAHRERPAVNANPFAADSFSVELNVMLLPLGVQLGLGCGTPGCEKPFVLGCISKYDIAKLARRQTCGELLMGEAQAQQTQAAVCIAVDDGASAPPCAKTALAEVSRPDGNTTA